MKRGTPEHPKMIDFAEAIHGYLTGLDFDLPCEACEALACGIIEKLFHYTARYAPAGDIGKHSNVRIARALGWVWDADWLIDTLSSGESARWIDTSVAGVRLYVHDWHDHSDEAADRYLADNGFIYANGWKPRNKPRKHSKAWNISNGDNPHVGDVRETGKPRASHATETCGKRAIEGLSACKSESEPESKSQSESESEPKPEPSSSSPRDDGDDGSFVSSWEAVETRLAKRNVACWQQSASNARLCGASPAFALEIIDYADKHGLTNGALVYRLDHARPSIPIDKCWPIPDSPPAADDGERRKRERDEAIKRDLREAEEREQARQQDRQRKMQREADYGPKLDAMTVEQLVALTRGNKIMAERITRAKGGLSPVVREYLLDVLADERPP